MTLDSGLLFWATLYIAYRQRRRYARATNSYWVYPGICWHPKFSSDFVKKSLNKKSYAYTRRCMEKLS